MIGKVVSLEQENHLKGDRNDEVGVSQCNTSMNREEKGRDLRRKNQ